jgi:serine/threonine-protein kinase RsbW
MELNVTFALPRDSTTVPLVRHILVEALTSLGVTDACRGEIELAVAEACTNVLKHVTENSDQYEVSVEIDEESCEIRILDTGRGFDHRSFEKPEVSQTAEGGRGIMLMRGMVDDLTFVSEPEKGTVVHLVKRLELQPDSVLLTIEEVDARG